MSSAVLHVAPFDASQYPPLINTIKLTMSAGFESTVISSVPVSHPAVLAPARLFAAPRASGASAQLAHMTRALQTALRTMRPQLVVAHNLLGLLAAWQAKAFDVAHLVYHCHDFETHETHPLRIAERMASRRVSEMWVPAPERLESARQRSFDCVVRVVRNCPCTLSALPRRGRLLDALSQRMGKAPGPIITRHGRIGPAHCIFETIEALSLMAESATFVIIGSGDERYIEKCKTRADELGVLQRVWFHGPVSHAALSELLIDGSVGMCMYAPLGPNEAAPAPNKVYENLALGVPVVVTSGNSVAGDVVSSGAGVAIQLGDRRRIADALEALIHRRDAAIAARRAHLDRFNYEVEHRCTLLGSLCAGAET